MANRDDYLRRKQQSDSETDLLASLVFDVLNESTSTSASMKALKAALSGRKEFDDQKLIAALKSVASLSREDAKHLARTISTELSLSRRSSRQDASKTVQAGKDTTEAVEALRDDLVEALAELAKEVATKREDPIPVDVRVDVPDVRIPKIEIPKIEVPEVKVPKIDVTPIVDVLREKLSEAARQEVTVTMPTQRPEWLQSPDFAPVVEAIREAVSNTPKMSLPLDESGRLPVAVDRTGGMAPGLAKDKTLEKLFAEVQNQATEAKQDEILAELVKKTSPSDIQMSEMIPVLRAILTAIANPPYVDKSANAIRNQVQSGTITAVGTVTTVTGMTNLDGYQAKMLTIGQNISAWSGVVRSRIS